MKTIKAAVSAVLIFVMLTAQAFAADAYETGVRVTLDGNEIIYSDVHEPVIKNGRTLVPMRKTFEAMERGRSVGHGAQGRNRDRFGNRPRRNVGDKRRRDENGAA